MKLMLHIHFETDGDYSVDGFSEVIDIESRMYGSEPLKYRAVEGFEEYDFLLEYEGKGSNECRWAARDVLQGIIVRLRVSQSHYYLVKDLYDLLQGALDELWKDENVDYNKLIYGNYQGTEVSLHVLHEENDSGAFQRKIFLC